MLVKGVNLYIGKYLYVPLKMILMQNFLYFIKNLFKYMNVFGTIPTSEPLFKTIAIQTCYKFRRITDILNLINLINRKTASLFFRIKYIL